MVLYLILIGILYINSFINFGKWHKAFYWFMVVSLAVVSGVRYYVGTDFGIQKNYYDWTVAGLTDGWLEPGFRLYIRIIENYFGDFQAFIFIAAIFVVLSFGYAIYKNVEQKYQFFSLSLFVTTTIYFATMNIERQYIAIAFLIWSVEKLKEKKYIRTMLLFVFAVSFHESAIVFVLYYILYLCLQNKQWKKQVYKCINIVVIIVVASIFVDYRFILSKVSFLIPSAHRSYLTSRFLWDKDWDSILKMLFPLLIWGYLYFIQDLKETIDENLKIFIPAYFFWISINVLFSGINLFIRLGMYFEYFILFLYPLIVDKGKDEKIRFGLKLFFLGYYFALTSYSIFYNLGHGVIPYQTFFNH